VLTDREDVEARFFRVLRDRHGVADPLRLARRLTRDGVARDVADAHQAELHALPRGVVVVHEIAPRFHASEYTWCNCMRPNLFPRVPETSPMTKARPTPWDGLSRSRLNAGCVRLLAESKLSTQAQARDQSAVALDVDALEVAEQAATLTDEQEQTTTRVVVVLVLLEVLRQVGDATRQHRNLHLGGSGVTGVRRVLFDDRLLHCSFKCHRSDPLSSRCAVPVAGCASSLYPRPSIRQLP